MAVEHPVTEIATDFIMTLHRPLLDATSQLQELREGAWILIDVDAEEIQRFQAEGRIAAVLYRHGETALRPPESCVIPGGGLAAARPTGAC